jgi:hypothetical protein
VLAIIRQEAGVQLRLAKGVRLGRPRRIEITAFRRRTFIAPGGEHPDASASESTITEIHLGKGDTSGMTENDAVESIAQEIKGVPDLMKLIEVLMNLEGDANRTFQVRLNRSRFQSTLRLLGIPIKQIKAALRTNDQQSSHNKKGLM